MSHHGWVASLLWAVWMCACSGDGDADTRSRIGAIELRSDHSALVDGFNWAKRQALAYVFEGDPVGKWYEAALPGREAFCMRDVSVYHLGVAETRLTNESGATIQWRAVLPGAYNEMLVDGRTVASAIRPAEGGSPESHVDLAVEVGETKTARISNLSGMSSCEDVDRWNG